MRRRGGILRRRADRPQAFKAAVSRRCQQRRSGQLCSCSTRQGLPFRVRNALSERRAVGPGSPGPAALLLPKPKVLLPLPEERFARSTRERPLNSPDRGRIWPNLAPRLSATLMCSALPGLHTVIAHRGLTPAATRDPARASRGARRSSRSAVPWPWPARRSGQRLRRRPSAPWCHPRVPSETSSAPRR